VKKPEPEWWSEAVRLRQSGLTSEEVGQRLGKLRQVIYKVCRKKDVNLSRTIAWWEDAAALRELGFSYDAIGKRLGKSRYAVRNALNPERRYQRKLREYLKHTPLKLPRRYVNDNTTEQLRVLSTARAAKG
jgi:hypothetical protein